MSPSPLNLYCNESPNELVCSELDIINQVEPFSSNVSIEDENFIDSIFNSELDQMPQTHSMTKFLDLPELVSARKDAVNWMFKVQTFYQFRPETAYLSVNYLDRFLLFHTLPEGKGWPLQLVAVACLSIAAKLEETRVPVLLDLQILEPRFYFKPNTIQRMELLVMTRLKWRLHIITPCHFLHYFIAKLSPFVSSANFNSVFSRSSDLIINTLRVINLLDFTPSAIAAAAVLWVANQTIDDTKIGCFHKRLKNDMVKKCHNVIKKNISKLSPTDNKVLNNKRGAILESCKKQRSFINKEFKSRHSSPPNKCYKL